MRAVALLALGIALLAVGAAGGYLFGRDDDDGDGGEVTAASALPAGWSLCTNPSRGFVIGYPGGWYSTHVLSAGACEFFDPEPFEIPRDSDFVGTALEAHPLSEARDIVVDGESDPMFARVVVRAETSVAGKAATRLETVSTGAGLYERGTRIYVYVLEREGGSFLVQTIAGPSVANYAERKRIVDRAVRTLRLSKPRAETAEPPPAQAGLPPAVALKREAIARAAQANDYEAIAKLVDPDEFEYTFGGAVRGGPTAYWRNLEATTPERPLQMLRAVLDLPYGRAQGVYVWPFAVGRDPKTWTSEEVQLLQRIAPPAQIRTWRRFGAYIGWRAGITADGRWIFFVAGD